jgi:hypothetical protein
MPHILDPVYFDKLKQKDPVDVCRRSLVSYNREERHYTITALGEECTIHPEKQEVLGPVREEPVSVELSLLLLVYLLQARDVPPEGRWVREFNLKGGAMFFRGPHAVRNDAVADVFGRDLDGFRKACEALGGTAVDQTGDAAYRFQVLPRIPAVVSLWYGDEEFEASAGLLMDPTIEQHLPLDVIFGMSLELYSRITGRKLWV